MRLENPSFYNDKTSSIKDIKIYWKIIINFNINIQEQLQYDCYLKKKSIGRK